MMFKAEAEAIPQAMTTTKSKTMSEANSEAKEYL